MRHATTYALRLALRSLLRARGMTLLAMLTLGAGLTAAVAVLGVLDSAVRSLPVPDGGDVVALEVRDARAERTAPEVPLGDWIPGPGVLEAGAVRTYAATMLHPEHGARRVYGAAMHASVLPLLRVSPALGRIPTPGDEPDAVVLLSHRLHAEFGGRPAILGETVEIDGQPHTVIGVMPERFGFPERQDFWTLLPEHAGGEIVVRLAPGTRRDAAGAALGVRLDAAAAAHAVEGAPHHVAVRRWTTSREGGDDETAVFAGLGVLVLLLLLVCCANVATLLLVRGTERANVLAVQGALGATRAQVALQLFLESLLIAVGGGVAGLAGGFLLLQMMELRLSSHWGYYWMTMTVRPPVLLTVVGLVLLSALTAGTVPALRASRVDLAGMLTMQARGGDRRQRRLGRWFVGAQVALSSLGLIAAIYMTSEFAQVRRTVERLPLDRVAVARLTLPDGAYADAGSRRDLVERLRAELSRIPGVTRASVSASVPGGAPPVARVHLPDDEPEARPRVVPYAPADAELLAAYGMRVVAGEPLGSDARAGTVMVSVGFAERYLEGAALGKRLRLAGVHGDAEWAEVVGVFEDWYPPLRNLPAERIIVPLEQGWREPLFVSLEAGASAVDVLGGVRAAIARADDRIPVEQLETLRDRMAWYNRMMLVIAGFAAMGGLGSAAVAAIGLYGVMSFQVRTRRREIGIRMAVGAARRRIMVEIVRESVLRVAPGLVVGVCIALAAVPLLASRTGDGPDAAGLGRLVGVSALAAALLLAVGVIAALEPALRAARLEPQQVLRAD